MKERQPDYRVEALRFQLNRLSDGDNRDPLLRRSITIGEVVEMGRIVNRVEREDSK